MPDGVNPPAQSLFELLLMDFMKYNIDYEIFGLLVMLIILVFFKLKFDRQTESEKSFLRLGVVIVVALIMDMGSAITISIGGPKMAVFNLLFTTAYFAVELYMGMFFIDYILVSAYGVPHKNTRICLNIFGLLYILSLFLNMFHGFYFEFDFTTGEYIHLQLYDLLYLVPSILILYAIFLVFYHRKRFVLKQWLSVCSFVLFVVIGLLFQALVNPNIYLTFGLVTISYLMIVFTLETPDYRKLMETMDELDIARKDAEESRKEAERANQVKGDFLANMSHEIRTPLNSILGFDELILRETDGDIMQYASNIKLSGQTLLSLINDILDFSKIESGKMEIIPVEYELKNVITDLVLMITPRAEEKELKIRCDIDENLPVMLCGDDVRIRQVITNLLTNAVKYTESGEVVLSVKLCEKPSAFGGINIEPDEMHAGSEDGCVNNKSENDGAGVPDSENVEKTTGRKKVARIRFSVKDTGIGIRPEDRQALFNAFQRVDEKKNRNIEGTGLGLAITVRLLELMDSSLNLESEYGKGSDFYFVLDQPVVDEKPIGAFSVSEEGAGRTVEITRESFNAPDARILVVDDMMLNLVLFKKLLKNSGMTIDLAESGDAAIEKMKECDYDIIFLDHLMPGMDGIETLKKAVSEGGLDKDNTPVVALTANAISGAREMYISEGFTDYLTKPIEIKQLMAMLMKYIPADKIKMLKS